MSPAPARFLTVGEGGLAVELGSGIDEQVNARVHLLAAAVRRELGDLVEELVPTYRSLLLLFDPLRLPRARLVASVEALLAGLERAGAAPGGGRVVRVPVAYGGELGPDLAFVARHAGISEEEVIALHAGALYRVFMLGFTPGFPYLGGMSERIAAPRLDSPRARIPAGSVGIAGAQTGIYSVESPGGWRLIGRTPLRLFDPAAPSPFLLAAGDRVRFRPCSEREYRKLAARAEAGDQALELEPDAVGAPP
ncbi:MAG TPA: 5-oxoprolinase subunit PxpB [Anaeromyxobacteraceae bacterium]|nr:5-oxoprolinase subunit PxpB [Anaeromyxobacteraceae bacterium]